MAGYYPLRFGGLWDRRSFRRYRVRRASTWKTPKSSWLTHRRRRHRCHPLRQPAGMFLQRSQGRLGRDRWVERQAHRGVSRTSTSPTHASSGATCRATACRTSSWSTTATSSTGPTSATAIGAKRIHMRNSPRFPYGYDPRRILVGDVDGDGLADIVYVEDTQRHPVDQPERQRLERPDHDRRARRRCRTWTPCAWSICWAAASAACCGAGMRQPRRATTTSSSTSPVA